MTEDFHGWAPREETRIDCVTPGPLRRLAGILDHEQPPWRADELPPLGHWLFHLGDTRQSELASDGHVRRGGFMPPVPLPRRMWAGSRTRFLQSVPIGAEIVRRSNITKIVNKGSQAGALTIVTVRHEITFGRTVAIEEDEDIAFVHGQRSRPKADAERLKPQISRTFHASPTLLFRFSALTFNAHRIHYDQDYARDVEHYPGVVVQGPLLATLLVDHFLRHCPAAPVKAFSCQARAPVFNSERVDLCLAANVSGADLWILGSDTKVRMRAQIEVDSRAFE
jgi:3-methylfumaryl-CoA hydratase